MDRYQIEAIHESAAGQRLAQRQPLPGSVYEMVTDMLMTHAFEPGARLNIEELARTLGVSPTPIREALARVKADGLIVKQPGRSYTVAPLMGIEQVRELIELRLLVEPAMAARAAAQADQPDQGAAPRGSGRWSRRRDHGGGEPVGHGL